MINMKTFLSKAGHYTRVAWSRDCKVRVGAPRIEKTTVATVRAGIDYDNKASVIAKRESGELPAVNAGLPWGNWAAFPHLIEHKGNFYARFYPAENGNVMAEYRMNGKLVSYETVEPYLLSGEKRKGEKPECFTVKLDNIIELY